MRTIIFISGIFVPRFVGKSFLIWDDKIWTNYNRVHICSKHPTSDNVIEKELDRLKIIIDQYDKPILAGQSLGGFWAANLACRRNIDISKLILFTPMCESNGFPLFDYTNYYNPCNIAPNKNIIGNTLVLYGNEDLIVPAEEHSFKLIKHFNSDKYELNGGHFYQTNHLEGLKYMQEWIEK